MLLLRILLDLGAFLSFNSTVETRIKEPSFLDDSLLKALICCLHNPYIRDERSASLIKTCKDCIFITVAFSIIIICQNVILNFSLEVIMIQVLLCGFLLYENVHSVSHLITCVQLALCSCRKQILDWLHSLSMKPGKESQTFCSLS